VMAEYTAIFEQAATEGIEVAFSAQSRAAQTAAA